MGGYFSLGREKPLPAANYGDQLPPVTVDVVVAGWITAFLLVYVSFLVILPGYSFQKGRHLALRVGFDLSIGLAIVLGLFDQHWEVAKIHAVHMPYKPGSGKEIQADIGLYIGLKGINITLKEVHDDHHAAAGKNKSAVENATTMGHSTAQNLHEPVWVKETINYNERFWWTWRQGRFGFGSEAGLMQQEFRAAQFRGVPIPILWVAEYFTLDGEGLRFGRRYRTAGWYAHFFLWCAFATWLLGNILLRMVVRKGAGCVILTGIFMILANVVWAFIRNRPMELSIPFGSKEEEILRTRFGLNFWGVLIAGLESILVGIAIYILDFVNPNFGPEFFDVDPLLEYKEAVVTREEMEQAESANAAEGKRLSTRRRTILRASAKRRNGNGTHDGMEMGSMSGGKPATGPAGARPTPKGSGSVLDLQSSEYGVLLKPKARTLMGAKLLSRARGDSIYASHI